MKTFFLLLSVAVFSLFSCASVQDKADSELVQAEISDTEDISGMGEKASGEAETSADFAQESAEDVVIVEDAAHEAEQRPSVHRAAPYSNRRPRPMPPTEPLPLAERAAAQEEALSEEESSQVPDDLSESPEEEPPPPKPTVLDAPEIETEAAETEPEEALLPAGAALSVSDEPEMEAEEAEAEPEEALLPASATLSVSDEPEMEIKDALDNEQLFMQPAPFDEEATLEEEESEMPEEDGEPLEEEPPPPEPSRAVSLSAGQNLEVWYPGQGWVFSGFRESSVPGGMAFSSRRFENRDTIFLFRALQPGTYILDFSRFDVLTGGYIEDSLRAEVFPDGAVPLSETQAFVKSGVVRAPDYEGVRIRAVPQEMPEEDESESEADDEIIDEPSVIIAPARAEPTASDEPPAQTAFSSDEPRAVSAGDAPQEESETLAEASFIAEGEEERESTAAQEGAESSAQDSSLVPLSESTAALNEIRAMIEAGEIDGALSALDSFFADYAMDTDEALFLLGQAYEADSPRRDMRRALSAYETLTQTYPLSRFWQAADGRIRYIRRFYFDMR